MLTTRCTAAAPEAWRLGIAIFADVDDTVSAAGVVDPNQSRGPSSGVLKRAANVKVCADTGQRVDGAVDAAADRGPFVSIPLCQPVCRLTAGARKLSSGVEIRPDRGERSHVKEA